MTEIAHSGSTLSAVHAGAKGGYVGGGNSGGGDIGGGLGQQWVYDPQIVQLPGALLQLASGDVRQWAYWPHPRHWEGRFSHMGETGGGGDGGGEAGGGARGGGADGGASGGGG